MSSLPQPLPPVPVQPIVYSTPAANRPGLITAIGVISIVVGSLGLMFNGIAGLQAFVMVMVSQASKAVVTAQQATQAAAPAPKVVDPISMPAEERRTVVSGLTTHRAISEPRREQLDALLLKCGRQIFQLSGPHLTVEVVRQNVTESGQLPDAQGGEGPDFFIVGRGRIELADDHAKFSPDNGAEIVRVNASNTVEQPNWEAGLTPAQVRGIIDEIEKKLATPLPAAQKSKLDLLLNSPAQGYFTPAPTIPEVTSQITQVSPLAAGNSSNLMLMTNGGMLTLDPQGNTVSSSTWQTAGFGGGGGFGGPMFNINMPAAIVALMCAGLSLALAIYLLVIGILVLRQHPRGGRLHKIYAWLKIPVAIVGGIAWVVCWRSFAIGAGGAGAGVTAAMSTGAAVAVIIGCLYPVALLITLRTREVREYYSTAR